MKYVAVVIDKDEGNSEDFNLNYVQIQVVAVPDSQWPKTFDVEGMSHHAIASAIPTVAACLTQAKRMRALDELDNEYGIKTEGVIDWGLVQEIVTEEYGLAEFSDLVDTWDHIAMAADLLNA